MFDRITICSIGLVCTLCHSHARAQVSLDGATTWQFEGVHAGGAVYNRLQDFIYASIGSEAGYPIGNSLAVLDIDSRSAIDYITIGSEPGKLTISDDTSRIHAAIEGAFSVRSYNTLTGTLGRLHPLVKSSSRESAVAEDLVVSKWDPDVVFVSLDVLISSSSGVLGVFDSDGEVPSPGFFTCNSLATIDPTTLVTYNNSNTGRELFRFSFDGEDLVFEVGRGNLISGGARIEAKDGLIYSTNGVVIDPETLTRLGAFTGGFGAVEPVPELGITYFMSGDVLKVFDNATFLLMDTIDLNIPSFSAWELFVAGENRLGYYSINGTLGIIEGIPVPKPCIVDFTGDGVINFFDISNFITAIRLENLIADFNSDGILDTKDVEEFLTAYSNGCH